METITVNRRYIDLVSESTSETLLVIYGDFILPGISDLVKFRDKGGDFHSYRVIDIENVFHDNGAQYVRIMVREIE